jgi:aspartate aminotransferase-like enzyme
MLRVGPYIFKQAESDLEFEQIHRLNYRTFVNEIRQYTDPGNEQLVDKFHHKNVYFIGQKHGRVVGMLSAHDKPPFSIGERLPDPSIIARPGMSVMEVRLLAVEPSERHSSLFFGLVYVMYSHAIKVQKTHLVISGVAQRMRMYQRLGFEPIGAAVTSGQASFVPMILTLADIPYKMRRIKNLWESHIDNLLRSDKSEWDVEEEKQTFRTTFNQDYPPKAGEAGDAEPPRPGLLAEAEVCLLPGPVTISPAVRQAFHQPPIYHRGPAFIRRFTAVRDVLGQLVGGRRVAILNGSGTLANETVAAALASIPWLGRGLMLVNGEFGERLVRQASRFGLHPRVLRWDWGEPWNLDAVEAALAEDSAENWVWGVHQESSTGVLNNLPGLVRVARRRGVQVCVDCISSLGAVPIQLQDVFLATGSSGKSLGSIAGAALVFADPGALERIDRSRIPSYFDLVAALTTEGPCYTFPSPTLLALEAALGEYSTPERAQAVYNRYAQLSRYVRRQLRELGLPPLARDEDASPVVTTFAPPGNESAVAFVERCLSWGIAIGGQSGYLAQRRLVQIATMGAVSQPMCEALFGPLATYLAREPALAAAR